MIPFLSCDWGTTSFRLNLADAENFSVIYSVATNNGILATHNSWINAHTDPATKIPFYLAVIHEQITVLEQKLNRSLDGTPLLISGMASSSIGMKQLPYHELPFFLDGSGMLSEFIPQTAAFEHDTLLISGVRSEDDVMRGEETQLVGMFSGDIAHKGEKLFILPGTHSKHIRVSDNMAVSFKTYMTGEFFDLLSKKSILHAGLEEGNDWTDRLSRDSFEKGVRDGSRSNLLNICFKVRTNYLFERLPKKENYYYLSGLLIGAELGEIAHNASIEIYLCCGTRLKALYETAFEISGLKQNLRSYAANEIENAAMTGQFKIYEKYLKR